MTSLVHALDQPVQSPGRAPRTNLFLAATLIGHRSRLAVTVRNLSSSGALIRSQVPFEDEGPLCLVRGSLRANGVFVWRHGVSGGIQFDAPIDLADWAPGVARAGQMDVDRMVAQSRGQAVALAPPKLAEGAHNVEHANLIARIAEEIAFVSRKLEAVGNDLAEDPAVIIRHAAQLQDLDITIQVLGHLNRLLASDDPQALLSEIGMEDLRRRLQRTKIG